MLSVDLDHSKNLRSVSLSVTFKPLSMPVQKNGPQISFTTDLIVEKMEDGRLQTSNFDLTQNLNECEKKSEYTEKNLNLTTKIELLYRYSLPKSKPKNLNLGVRLSKFH